MTQPASPAAPIASSPSASAEAVPVANEGPRSTEPEKTPTATFDALPLSRELRESLAEMGYVHPTPVQLAVWEPVTRGRDAVVQARTGTGKTAAFGMPIVDQLVKRSLNRAQALVLTPTRELALQVAGEVERLGSRKGVKVTAIYGGAPMGRQIEAIAGGAQVVSGTPGRVLDHLRRGTLDPKHIRLVVLDESDEMLSMGFERELTSILELLPTERQTLLFSATLPPEIERIAKSKLKSPEFVTLSGDHIGALEIQHFVYLVAKEKMAALMRVIEVENPESAVIFCNTKDETENVTQALRRNGFDADWLNGDLAQSDREKVMSATREGRLRFLVATDVAARGIDISHLTHVINYDFPQEAESYVHRTGRTGRAGRTGTAISLITPHDVGSLYILRLTYKIRPIEKQIPTEGEVKTRAEADLVAMLAEAFLSKTIHPDDLSLARRLFSHDQADVILAGLLRDYLGARPAAKDEAAALRRAPKPPRRPAPRPEMALPMGGPRAPQTPGTAAGNPRAEAQPPNEGMTSPRAPQTAMGGTALARAERQAPPAAAAPVRHDPPRKPNEERPPILTPPLSPRGPTTPSSPSAVMPPLEHKLGDESVASTPARGFEGPRRAGSSADAPRDRPRRERLRDDASGGPPMISTGELERRPTSGGRSPQRHADFITWQPPEEEGDDQPIMGGGDPRALASPEGRTDASAPSAERARREAVPAARDRDTQEGNDTASDGDFTEIYLNAGRRDGARAADLQKLLLDRGVDRDDVRRIRVRERNAFVGVRTASVAKAIAALSAAPIAGKQVRAEVARDRSGENPNVAEGATAPRSPASPQFGDTETHEDGRITAPLPPDLVATEPRKA